MQKIFTSLDRMQFFRAHRFMYEIEDSLGFWFRRLDSRFQELDSSLYKWNIGFWIPIDSGIPNSTNKDSRILEPGFPYKGRRLRRSDSIARRPDDYPGCQRLFQCGFRFLSGLYSEPLRRSWLRPSANTENSGRTREKPLVPMVPDDGDRVKLYTGKTVGGEDPGGESESAPCPFPILPSIVFFMNFSPALYYLNACNRLREGASGMQEKTLLIES